MDLGRQIREQVREQVRKAMADAKRAQAAASGATTSGSSVTNVSTATTVGQSGHSVSIYSDNDVTIIQRDGETEVIRHDQKREPADENPGPAPEID
ncbi:MAG: hypothetical protein ABR540_12705 [Acidimicrobiales bacterium]